MTENPRAVRVAVSAVPGTAYPPPPFEPEEAYAELPVVSCASSAPRSPNAVYAQMRALFATFGLDREHFGTGSWNPLGALIEPGMKVVLKPNLVRHESAWTNHGAMVTHAAVVRCVLDYVQLALKGSGSVTIADAPIQSARLPVILEESGLCRVLERRAAGEVAVDLVDLRQCRIDVDDEDHYRTASIVLPGDPQGYSSVDLGASSYVEPLCDSDTRFGVMDYDDRTTNEYQRKGRHEYLIANTVLDADLVINLPKLKSHQKAGLTCALKNLVGINGNKDRLAHYRLTTASVAGDEMSQYSLVERLKSRGALALQGRSRRIWRAARAISRTIERLHRPKGLLAGAWAGNDTLWRTILDLNTILRHFDRNAQRRSRPRRVLTIVDGICAGDGDGPLRHRNRDLGVLIVGNDALAVDWVAARLVGFDPAGLKMISAANLLGVGVASDWTGEPGDLSLDFVQDEMRARFAAGQSVLDFDPPPGWEILHHRAQEHATAARARG